MKLRSRADKGRLRSQADKGRRNMRLLFTIYLAVFALLLAAAALQAAGALSGGAPAWYVWPLGAAGAGLCLFGLTGRGLWYHFLLAHAVLVVAASAPRLQALTPGTLGETLLPMAVLILVPCFIGVRWSAAQGAEGKTE